VLATLAEAGIAARAAPFTELGVVLEQAADPTALPGWDAGQFAVQGEASQLVVDMLGARAGARVLDACAAPGGKALAIATIVGESGLTVAVDRRRSGLRRLCVEAVRLGCRVAVAQGDATQSPLAPTARFDAVLVDAPCSGLGTLRQHPEIRWRRRPEDLAALAALQGILAARAADYVRPGGALVYATCTLSRLENEAVVDAFLRARRDFIPDDPRPLLPAAAHELVAADGALRTLPHRHGLDGFFAVRLRRSS
jgi:16S rRNA (cytosine967-C5)-methyltransferase